MLSLPQHWSFGHPVRLFLLIAVALVALAYVLAQRRRPVYEARLADVDLLDSVLPTRPGWRRHVPATLLLATLVVLTTGFAQPSADVSVARKQATIILAIDVSASMAATDVAPSRIEAAKQAAVDFAAGLPRTFDVGLVSFSDTAEVDVSATQDRAALLAGIRGLPLRQGTAIGEAVTVSAAAATATARQVGHPVPVRIVLLSDGGNTVGRSIAVGAQDAVAAGMPVTTIAYGTPDGSVVVRGTTVPVPVDGPALAELSSTTGGQAYTAQDSAQLNDSYDKIGAEVGRTTQRREITDLLTGLGLLLALGAAAGSLVWFRALP